MGTYIPNSTKTKLLIKHPHLSRAEDMNETDSGRYLEGVIGTEDFLRVFLENKVKEWKEEMETLINIAQSQPQAAYAAFTHGMMSKWN